MYLYKCYKPHSELIYGQMLRIANKRKEQDMDFEEKKLHLSVGGVVHDPDAELAYAAAAVGASPPHQELLHRDPELRHVLQCLCTDAMSLLYRIYAIQ